MSLFKPNNLSPNFEQIYEGDNLIFSFEVNTNMSYVRAYRIMIYDDKCLNNIDKYDNYIIGVIAGNFETPLQNGDKGIIKLKPQQLSANNINLEPGKNYVWSLRVYEDFIADNPKIFGCYKNQYKAFNFKKILNNNLYDFKFELINKIESSDVVGDTIDIREKDTDWAESNLGIITKKFCITTGDIISLDNIQNIFGGDYTVDQILQNNNYIYSNNLCFCIPEGNFNSNSNLRKIVQVDFETSKPKLNFSIKSGNRNHEQDNIIHLAGNRDLQVKRILINGQEIVDRSIEIYVGYLSGKKGIYGDTFLGQNFISGSTNKVMWIENCDTQISEDSYFGYDVYSDYTVNIDSENHNWSFENLNNSDFLPFGTQEIEYNNKIYKGVPIQYGTVTGWTVPDICEQMIKSIDSDMMINLGIEEVSDPVYVFPNGVLCSDLSINGSPSNLKDESGVNKFLVSGGHFIDFNYKVYASEDDTGEDPQFFTITGKRLTDKVGNLLGVTGRFENPTFYRIDSVDDRCISNRGFVFYVINNVLYLEGYLLQKGRKRLFSSNGYYLRCEIDDDNTLYEKIEIRKNIECTDKNTGEIIPREIITFYKNKLKNIYGEYVKFNNQTGKFITSQYTINDESTTKKCYDIRNWTQDLLNFVNGIPGDICIDDRLNGEDSEIEDIEIEEPTEPYQNYPIDELNPPYQDIDQENTEEYGGIEIPSDDDYYKYITIQDLKMSTFCINIKQKMDNKSIVEKFYVDGLDEKESVKLNSGDMWIKIDFGIQDNSPNILIDKFNYNGYKKIISSGKEKDKQGRLRQYVTINPYEGVFGFSNLNMVSCNNELIEYYNYIKQYCDTNNHTWRNFIPKSRNEIRYYLSYKQRQKISQVNQCSGKTDVTQIVLQDKMLLNKYQFGDRDNPPNKLIGKHPYQSICRTNLLNNKFDQNTVYIHPQDVDIQSSQSYLYVYYSNFQKIEPTDDIVINYPEQSYQEFCEYDIDDFKVVTNKEIDGNIEQVTIYKYEFNIRNISDYGYPADKKSIKSVTIYWEEKYSDSSGQEMEDFSDYPEEEYEYSQGILTLKKMRHRQGSNKTNSTPGKFKLKIVFDNLSIDVLTEKVKFRGGLRLVSEYDLNTGRVGLAEPLPCVPNEGWRYQVLNSYSIKMSPNEEGHNDNIELINYLYLDNSKEGILGSPIDVSYQCLLTNFSPYDMYSVRLDEAELDSQCDPSILNNCRCFIQKSNIDTDIYKSFNLELYNEVKESKIYSILDSSNGINVLNNYNVDTLEYPKSYKDKILDKITDDIWIFNTRYDHLDWDDESSEEVDVSPKKQLMRPQTRYRLFSNYLDAIPNAVFNFSKKHDLSLYAKYIDDEFKTVKLEQYGEPVTLYDSNIILEMKNNEEYDNSIKNWNDKYKIKKYKYLIYDISDNNGFYLETQYLYDEDMKIECSWLQSGTYRIIVTVVNMADKETILDYKFKIADETKNSNKLFTQIDSDQFWATEYGDPTSEYQIDCLKQCVTISLKNYDDVQGIRVYRRKIGINSDIDSVIKIFESEDPDEIQSFQSNKLRDYNICNKCKYQYRTIVKKEISGHMRYYISDSADLDILFQKYSLQNIYINFSDGKYITKNNEQKLFSAGLTSAQVTTNTNSGHIDSAGKYGSYSRPNYKYDSGTIKFIINDIDKIVNRNPYQKNSKQYNQYIISQVPDFKSWIDFIGNKKAKLLKDIKGNSWIIVIDPNFQISISYNNRFYVAELQFEWKEIANSETPIIALN